MSLDYRKPHYRAICAAAAAALVLTLGACGDKPPAETAGAKTESPGDAAARQAAVTAEKKNLEEQKRMSDPAKQAADARVSADSALAAKVKSAIVATPGLKNLPMDVRASGGAVTLYGTADSEAQRLKAEKAAAGVLGVSSVNNKLLLVSGS